MFRHAVDTSCSFNRTLMHQRGVAMGEEFRGKGVNVLLGPSMSVLLVIALVFVE
jgi:beta-glucosidase